MQIYINNIQILYNWIKFHIMNMFTLVCCIMYTIMRNYCIKLFTVPYYFFYCSFVLFCHCLHFLFVGIIYVSVWLCNMCDGDVSEYTCTWHGTSMEIRGRLSKVESSLSGYYRSYLSFQTYIACAHLIHWPILLTLLFF